MPDLKRIQSFLTFYKEYREGRPEIGMFEQDWTLPEPAVDTYTDEMFFIAERTIKGICRCNTGRESHYGI